MVCSCWPFDSSRRRTSMSKYIPGNQKHLTLVDRKYIEKKSMPVARSFSAVSNVPPVQPATRHVRTLSKNDVTDSIKHLMCVMVVQKQSITARLPTNTAMMLFLLIANTKNVSHSPAPV